MSGAALKLTDASVRYGALRAVQGVSIIAPAGSITAVVGTNGAGKSSLLRAIAGVTPMSGGRVEIPEGNDVTGLPAYKRVRNLGVSLVPENRALLYQMTIEENLALGFSVTQHRPGQHRTHSIEDVMELFPVLGKRRSQLAGDLSGGEQQMLTIGRALLTDPKLLLLDEPSMGLAPLVIEIIFESLATIMKAGSLSVILVEQNTELALDVSANTYVMERGRITLEGPSKDVAANPSLRETYLGM